MGQWLFTHTDTHTHVHAQAHPVHLHIKSIRCFYERASSKSCFPKVTSRQVINIYIYFCTYTTPHYTSHSLALFLSSSLSLSLSLSACFRLGTKKKFAQNFTLNKFNNKNVAGQRQKMRSCVSNGRATQIQPQTHTLTHMHIPLRFSIIVSK